MLAEDQLEQAFKDKDWETATHALNRLEQEVVEAVQSDEAERLQETEIKLAALLRGWRRELGSEEGRRFVIIGSLSGLHGLTRALREDKPSRGDLTFVREGENRVKFVQALRRGVSLRACDILERTSIPHLTTVSEVGKELEQFGLVARDRSGKGSAYWLTLRGNLVARHLGEEDRVWVRETAAVASLAHTDLSSADPARVGLSSPPEGELLSAMKQAARGGYIDVFMEKSVSANQIDNWTDKLRSFMEQSRDWMEEDYGAKKGQPSEAGANL